MRPPDQRLTTGGNEPINPVYEALLAEREQIEAEHAILAAEIEHLRNSTDGQAVEKHRLRIRNHLMRAARWADAMVRHKHGMPSHDGD